jgi:putative transcriptional regulator
MRQLHLNIKTLREERGISQGKLAQLTGVSQSAISDIENNKRNPSLWTVHLIAEVLEVPVDALMLGQSKQEVQ